MRNSTYIYTISFLIVFIGTITSCGSLINMVSTKPHKMQYLVVRNYLYDMGLSRATELFDLNKNSSITAVHIADSADIVVKNYMQFDTNGNLLSVRKLAENTHLVNFRYDKNGRLTWIVPNLEQFPSLEYDSLHVVYKMGKPIQLEAITNNTFQWLQNIDFNDLDEQYRFSRSVKNAAELFDSYNFKDGQIVAEYHKNNTTDTNVDSIKYTYQNNKLVEVIGVFNKKTSLNTTYDELERPRESVVVLADMDSIIWTDRYFYQANDQLPYKIVTSSSLGWNEVVYFKWN